MKNYISMALLACLCASSVSAEETENTFTLDGEFGLILTTGNTDTTSIKTRLISHQELVKWSNDYVAEVLYKQDEVALESGLEEKATTAQRWFVSAQGNYKLEDPNNRLFGFVSYEDDRFNSFAFQSTIAAGWSSKVWDDDKSRFSYSIGPGYSLAEREDGESVNNFIVRAAADYEWKISETADFKQVFSTEVGSENIKSKSETSLSARLYESLSMKFSIILNHNSEVNDGVEKLDTETAATLVYTFF